MESSDLFKTLRYELKKVVDTHNLYNEKISIVYRSLSTMEAIGNPIDQDYPIIKGKEKMIEATFRSGRGQAFTDEYGNGYMSVQDLLTGPLGTNRERANFIAAFNAIFRHFDLCEKTVHCKDEEPIECGKKLLEEINPSDKVLLVGLQPRLLQSMSGRNQQVRVVDMDQDSIGKEKFGVFVEDPSMTEDGIDWCDIILATGSTIVNESMPTFLNSGKPTIFFGITAAGPAAALGLRTFCGMGH